MFFEFGVGHDNVVGAVSGSGYLGCLGLGQPRQGICLGLVRVFTLPFCLIVRVGVDPLRTDKLSLVVLCACCMLLFSQVAFGPNGPNGPVSAPLYG